MVIRRKKKKVLRKKVCRLCESSVKYIDFKDTELLRKYQTEKGKILPRRVTGNCMDHQRMLSVAIKRARELSLVL